MVGKLPCELENVEIFNIDNIKMEDQMMEVYKWKKGRRAEGHSRAIILSTFKGGI